MTCYTVYETPLRPLLLTSDGFALTSLHLLPEQDSSPGVNGDPGSAGVPDLWANSVGLGGRRPSGRRGPGGSPVPTHGRTLDLDFVNSTGTPASACGQDARAPRIGVGWVRRDDALPFAAAKQQLAAYFEGRLREFDLPLAPIGTPFQQRVWEALRQIPYGLTLSYGELARRIGRPGSARAVGLANGRNPVAIIVPCHRVIGADGRLVGYGGGLGCKQALLAFEAAVLAGQTQLVHSAPRTGSPDGG
jgi:O-6-methylguanine DNA methyltransferase